VGDEGTILFYNGEYWSPQISNTSNYLLSVCFIDNNRGWAAGDKVLLFYDGQDWVIQQNLDILYRIYSVHFGSETNGYFVGEYGYIMKFNGHEWIQQNLNFWFYNRCMSIVSNNYGWIFDTSDRMLFFDGTDWSIRNYSNGDNYIYSSHFLNENLGWIAGDQGVIYKYENGNWILEQYIPNSYFYAIYMVDDKNGWTGYQSIFKYNGSEWLEEFDNNGFLESLFFTDIYHGWAITGTSFSITESYIYSYDGENWSLNQTIPGVVLHDVFFTDSINGWAVGDLGTILKFDDNEWIAQPSPTMERLNDVFFLDQNHGWICGDYGTILYYNGDEWNIQNSGTVSYLNEIYFTDSLNGWVAGEQSIFYTTSGGNLITGIEDLHKLAGSQEFLVYPNPSKENITLNINLQINSRVSIKLYDLKGFLVIDRTGEHLMAGINQVEINISDLPAGVYVCKLQTTEGQSTQKFVKF